MSDNINKIKEYIINEKSKIKSGDIEQYIYEDILWKIENIINESNFNKTKQKYGCGYWDICTKRIHFEDLKKEDNINIGLCLVIGKEFDHWEYEYMKDFEPDDILLGENLEYIEKQIDSELDSLINDDCIEDCYEIENYKYKRKIELESECYKGYFQNTNCEGCRVYQKHKKGIEQAREVNINLYNRKNPFDDEWLD